MDFYEYRICKKIIELEHESLDNFKTKFKIDPSDVKNTNSADITQIYNNLVESINVMHDEIECLNTLEEFLNFVESSNMRLVLKCRIQIEENQWMEMQIIEFQNKLIQLQKEWIKLELEWNVKLYFYKMRHLENSVEFIDKVYSLDYVSSDDSDSYEPEESYSIDVRPICNIIKESMLDWRIELAISWCREILIMYKEKEGDYSNNIRDLYEFLGRIYKRNKQFKKSKSCFLIALEIQSKLDPNDNMSGLILHLIGITLYKQKDYHEAEIYFRKALNYREVIIGQFHPDMIDLYYRLGNTYNKLGMYKESIFNCNGALQTLENLYEEDDSHLIRCYLIVIDGYIELQMKEKALIYLEKICRTTFLKNFKDEVLYPLNHLLLKYSNQSDTVSGSSMLIIFGKIQTHYSENIIKIISKYLVVFNLNESLQILIEWCEMSNLSTASLIYKVPVKEKSNVLDSVPRTMKSSISQESQGSLKSLNLKAFRNKMKESFKTFKKQF